MPDHELYMQRCLQLAGLGAGRVSPNPLVGSVIVHEGIIIGEGWHRSYGEAHAEVNAIQDVYRHFQDAKDKLRNATLYVNLEPCAHTGKTPPCADRIVAEGIPRVVVGTRDPFAKVNGRGIARLREAGVSVEEDVLKDKSRFLNRRFFTSISKHRPYVVLKWAQTADGYFAQSDGTQKWISGQVAKTLVHKWRSEEDAVLVGKNTALHDNPELTVRLFHGRNPRRVVIDKHLQLPQELHLFDGKSDTIVFNAEKTDWSDNLKYVALENFDWYLPQNILYQLHLLDVQSILIEGGAKTLKLFTDAGLWDEVRLFSSPDYWLDGIKAPALDQAPLEEYFIAKDRLAVYYNHTHALPDL